MLEFPVGAVVRVAVAITIIIVAVIVIFRAGASAILAQATNFGKPMVLPKAVLIVTEVVATVNGNYFVPVRGLLLICVLFYSSRKYVCS